MKFLVTGSSGFIGKNLCAALRQRGHAIYEYDLENHQDIRDWKQLSFVARNFFPDVVVHLAAISGLKDCESDPVAATTTNVVGTMNIATLGRRTVFASSGAVYAQDPGVYAMTKRLGERFCDVSLRFSNVYGPHSLHKTSVIHAFIQNALAGKPLKVHGDGKQVRDFIYVEDLVEAIICAAENDYTGSVNISSGRGLSILSVARMIAARMDASVEHDLESPSGVKSSVLPWLDAGRELGWAPHTELGEGLDRTIEWYCGK